MSDHRDPGKKTRQIDGFRILLTVSMLFLAVVLAVSAIRHLSRGLIFSGVIGLLGTVLFTMVGVILLAGLIKRFLTKREK